MSTTSSDSASVLTAGSSTASHTSAHYSSCGSTSPMGSPNDSAYASPTESDPEIKEYRRGLKRLEEEKMQRQRYQLSAAKRDEQAALALVGKVQRSLERRYHNQDAEMKPKKSKSSSEKR